MRYSKYMLLRGKTAKELETKVNEEMKNGWQPLGGVKPTVTEKSSAMRVHVEYFQTMVK